MERFKFSHAVTNPVKSCNALGSIDSLAEVKNLRMVTLAEAKKAMGVTTNAAVRIQIRKGRLRAVRFNNGLLIRLTDIHRYVRLRNKGALRKGGRPRKRI